MSVADFYLLLEPEFGNKERTKVKRIKAVSIRQTPPEPVAWGMWIKCQIEVPDTVFTHLIPRLEAKISSEQMEAMLKETSELFVQIVGLDDES